MNMFYDKEQASASLEDKLMDPARTSLQADIPKLDELQAENYQTFAVSEPPSYRLKDAGARDAEEVIFRLRGIVCQNRLPPIYRVRNKDSIAFLRQSVQMASFKPGSRFQLYFDKVNEAVRIFEASIPGKVHPPSHQMYEGTRCLVISNPLFTRRNISQNMESLSFDSVLDPSGFLSRNQPGPYHHTMDNQVFYLSELASVEAIEQVPTSPDRFDNGDIVEAQFSFVAFPTNKQKDEYQIRLCLRALILLSDKFRRESLSPDARHEGHIVAAHTLKRKVNYTDRLCALKRGKQGEKVADGDERDDDCLMSVGE